MASEAVESVIALHRTAGEAFQAEGVGSFVRAEGDGDPVVLIAAESRSAIREAKKLIRIEVEKIPPIFTIEGCT